MKRRLTKIDYQEPPSEHPSQGNSKKDDDDDDDDQNDDPQPGQGGIQKASKGSGDKATPSNAQRAPSSSPPKSHQDTQQAEQIEEITAAEFRIEQLKQRLEEERRINLECQALIEEKEAKIQNLREANDKELALRGEQTRLRAEITRTTAKIDAMSVGDDDEHNAKAASERPSTSQKASTLSGK